MNRPYGVVVMAYGTPRRREDIAAYYTDIRRGRPPSAEQLADLTRRYDAIGGLSPLIERTEAQRAMLAKQLENEAPGEFTVASDSGTPNRTSKRLSSHSPMRGCPDRRPRAGAALLGDVRGRLPRTSGRGGFTTRAAVHRDRELGDGAGVRRSARRRPRRIVAPDASTHPGAVHGPLAPPPHPRHRRSVSVRGRRDRHGRGRARLASPRTAGRSPGNRLDGRRNRGSSQTCSARSTRWRLLGRWTASWSARAGSSPITSKCSTTSMSRPGSAPKRPGSTFRRTSVANDDSGVMAALARRIIAAADRS